MSLTCSSLLKGYGEKSGENWIYKGEFIQGEMNGNGTIFYLKNNKLISLYSGQWINNNIHGQGNFVYGPETYQGNWYNNKKNGYGKHIFKKDDIFDNFEGYFNQDKRHGFGIQETESYYFSGNWNNDSRFGIGIINFKNGNTYIGEFENNQIKGNFINIDSSNKVSFGYFYNGIIEKEINIKQLKILLKSIFNSNLVDTLKENKLKLDLQKINIINSLFGRIFIGNNNNRIELEFDQDILIETIADKLFNYKNKI